MSIRRIVSLPILCSIFLQSYCVAAQETLPEEPVVAYVPMRAITAGPGAHWFGYYDKHQFDPSGRYILGMSPPFEGRTPGADDVVELGVVDTQDGDRWIRIGESRAWNWQQGCMLQWVPETEDTIIYNDRRDGRFVSVIRTLGSDDERVLSHPIYSLAAGGEYAVTLNFARLATTRPGYGYTGVPYHELDRFTPEDDGVWRLNLETGERTLLHSLGDIAAIANREGMDGGLHWINHLLVNPDGTRTIFLHRWRESENLKSRWNTRMFTTGLDGLGLHLVADHGMVSHFIWREPNEILAWSREPETGNRFHFYEDQSGKVSVIGEGVLTRDGHCTYSPDGQWILTDTYPDKKRMQALMLYRPSDGKIIPLGKFFLPRTKQSEFRCDLHPRWSRDGKTVCIDSMHTGARQMYLLDVGDVIARN